jgi:hypothetical protein
LYSKFLLAKFPVILEVNKRSYQKYSLRNGCFVYDRYTKQNNIDFDFFECLTTSDENFNNYWKEFEFGKNIEKSQEIVKQIQ